MKGGGGRDCGGAGEVKNDGLGCGGGGWGGFDKQSSLCRNTQAHCGDSTSRILEEAAQLTSCNPPHCNPLHLLSTLRRDGCG